MRRCEGITASGNRCRRTATPGHTHCAQHGQEAEIRREQQKQDVLEALPRVFSYAAAASLVGVTAVTLRWWREEDPAFAAACLKARGDALDMVESAMMRRAIGFHDSEDVYFQGEIVGQKRKFIFSDRAGEILLQNRPQYRRTALDAPPDPGADPVDARLREALIDPDRSDDIAELLEKLDPA